MKAETPITGNAVTKDFIDISLIPPDGIKPQWPTNLVEFLTEDPKSKTFPFFQRIENTEPGKAFFVWGGKKDSDQLFIGDDTDLSGLLTQFSSPDPRTQGRQLLAIVVVKDREKGVLKPTYDELCVLRNLNKAGKIPGHALLIEAGIRTLYSQIRDIELFLTAETRGRTKEPQDTEVKEAISLVQYQAESKIAAAKLNDKFHRLWQFAFVTGAKLSPRQAREDIKKFQRLTA